MSLLTVDQGRIVAAGAAGAVSAPEGAARVVGDLFGSVASGLTTWAQQLR